MKKAPFPPLLPRGNVFPFLLLLVVALSRAKDVDAWATPSCTDADMVLREGDVRITANKTREDKKCLGETVFMWPKEGFRGIALQAVMGSASGQQRVAVWFSKDSLFTTVNTGSWWQLLVHVYRFRDHVEFSVVAGAIRKLCASSVTSDNLQSLEVVGYGPSRWGRATEPPPGCPYETYNPPGWPPNPPSCTVHPPFTRATTPIISRATTPLIPRATTPSPIPEATPKTMTTMVGVVVAVVALMVAAVAAVVVYCRKQRRSADENVRMRFQGAPSPSESEVVENSLYETLENTSGTAVVENSLYETFENTGVTVVVENSLYETFDNVRKPR